jgi:hypothetical protein
MPSKYQTQMACAQTFELGAPPFELLPPRCQDSSVGSIQFVAYGMGRHKAPASTPLEAVRTQLPPDAEIYTVAAPE